MKTLTTTEIDRIKAYLQEHGLSHQEVLEDVLDHMACELENLMKSGLDFEAAFEEIQNVFPPEEVKNIQSDTLYFLTIKRTTVMIKGIFITAYMSLAIFAMSFGFEYFFIQVAYSMEVAYLLSGLCKFAGISIFCFAFLPLLFMYGYKRFMKQVLA